MSLTISHPALRKVFLVVLFLALIVAMVLAFHAAAPHAAFISRHLHVFISRHFLVG